jgi:hypothetical protein
MSYDLSIEVNGVVSGTKLAETLSDLAAPFDLAGLREGWFDIELRHDEIPVTTTGLEWWSPEPGSPVWYGLTGRDPDLMWVVATALAIAGDGSVHDTDGKAYAGDRLWTRGEKASAKLRDRSKKAYAKLSDEEKALRRRRPGESEEVYGERRFLATASEMELTDYFKRRITAALDANHPAELERIVGLLPRTLAFVEPALDPCFRSSALDPIIPRAIAAHFGETVLREHLLAAVGWVGVAAVPYAAFVLALTGALADEVFLATLRDRASSQEMRDALH